MKIIKKYKKLKQQSEGLYVVRLGLRVQMEGVKWHKDHPDISEDDRKEYALIYKVLEHWFNKVDKAWNGELKLE